ncbi:Enolase C-terminal domain-like protein [Mycena indigotica]|uniref:Enolase C-terminal domain-like protein n=1 Tax=Mycena indigotica TaxID=2126181 RepID=A0A8H6VS92_9AGAR|nr:Enolase C-terminal domain-like protein [Mycena indigotica]KAF7292112.1 Enolase C-terminal domain-like protein [Mycena indigotica]
MAEFPTGLHSPGANAIKTIETFYVRPRWLFVRVETESGVVGWGEATLEGHTEAVEGVFTDLRERFIGWDSAAIEDIWQTAYRLRFYRGGPVMMSAISGLDIALWDIKGKTLGVPVWQLLGGKVRDKCRCYGWIGGDKPSDVLAQAVARKAEGFTAVKMNAVEDVWSDAFGVIINVEQVDWLASPDIVDAVVERVKEVKSIGIDVGLDFHGRVHRPLAKQLAKALEPHRPLFIEEPLLPGQPQEIQALAASTTIPIALGERLFTRQEFRPYFEAGCVDIVQPDVAHAGGISEVRRIANMAEYVTSFVHLFGGINGLQNIRHRARAALPARPHRARGLLAARLRDAELCHLRDELEGGIHYNSAEHDLLTYIRNPAAFAVRDGMVDVAGLSRPGLGIDIDEKRVRAEDGKFRAGEVNAWRNPVWRGPDGALREW